MEIMSRAASTTLGSPLPTLAQLPASRSCDARQMTWSVHGRSTDSRLCACAYDERVPAVVAEVGGAVISAKAPTPPTLQVARCRQQAHTTTCIFHFFTLDVDILLHGSAEHNQCIDIDATWALKATVSSDAATTTAARLRLAVAQLSASVDRSH